MKTWSLLLLSLFTVSIFAADNKVQHVDPDGAAKLLEKGGITIVDVRTKDEFSEGHLKGAVNIDILEPNFEQQLGKLDKNQPVLVHCQAGGRSTRSLATFEKLGFSKIIHLDGGYGSWVESGKPVVKP
ncbi:MAG: rhodanese-like domain-containing protein [Prosthecobacter sp.]|nr:rhodanese-like domain-containing protein [Prosthecobacter sp.]